MTLNLRSSPRKSANINTSLNATIDISYKPDLVAPAVPLLDGRAAEAIPKDSKPCKMSGRQDHDQSQDLNHLEANGTLAAPVAGRITSPPLATTTEKPTIAAANTTANTTASTIHQNKKSVISALHSAEKRMTLPAEKRVTRSRAAIGTTMPGTEKTIDSFQEPPRKKRIKMSKGVQDVWVVEMKEVLHHTESAASVDLNNMEGGYSRPLSPALTLQNHKVTALPPNPPPPGPPVSDAPLVALIKGIPPTSQHSRLPPPPLVIKQKEELENTRLLPEEIKAIDSLLEDLKSVDSGDESDLSAIDLDHPLFFSSEQDDSSSSEDEQDSLASTLRKRNGKATRGPARSAGPSSALSLKKKGTANNTQAGGPLSQKEQLINPFLKRNYSHLLLNEDEIRQDLELIRKCWATDGSDAAAGDAGVSTIGPTVGQDEVLETAPPSHNRRSAIIAPSSLKLQTIDNNDNCSACLGTGELLCCDTCPRVFHFSCVAEGFLAGEREPEDTWQCRSCIARFGRLNADKTLTKHENKDDSLSLSARLMRKSVSNDHISLPEPDGDDEMSIDIEDAQDAVATQPPPLGPDLPLFKQLFQQMDGLNPRAFQLPISIRNAFQHIVSHPITGDYMDTHDTLLLKSSGNGNNVGRVTRKRVLSGDVVGDVAFASHHQTLPQQPQHPQQEDQPRIIEQQPTCFKCNKTDQLALQPPPLLTHSFPSKLKGIVGQSQSFRTTLIKCDHCAQYWHLDCLDPPLVSVPLPLRSDEWSPIDLLAYSQLTQRIRGTPSSGSGSGSGWRPFHPLDQPLHPIPPVLGLDKSDGDVYSAADIQLLSIAAPESGVFNHDRYLLIRPKWMCPLHAEWASPYSHLRVAWTPTDPAWKIYTDRAGEVRQARLKQLEAELAAEKKRIEQEKVARVDELKRKGFVHVDFDPSTLAVFNPPSVSVPESKLIIEFGERVGWMVEKKNSRQSTGTSSRKARQQARLRDSIAAGKMGKQEKDDDEDDDTQNHQPAHSSQQPQSSIGSQVSNLLENAKISLRPDMYAKFREFGSEWSSARVDELHEMTVGPDLDKFIPLVDDLVASQVDPRPFYSSYDNSQVQETAAALLLFQLELQDRFAERHLGLDPDQA